MSLYQKRAISFPIVMMLIATSILTYHTYNREIIDKKTWLTELETKGYSYSTLTITIDKVLLEGKPFYETSKLIMIVHNFTKCPSVLLYHGKFKPKLTFKVFVKLIKLHPIEGGVVPIVTPIHNYAITIIYWNGKELYDAVIVVEVVPNEPTIVKTVSLNLKKTPKGTTKGLPSFGLALLGNVKQGSGVREDWDYKYEFTKVAEVHSIQGSRAKIVFEEGSCVKVQELRRRWYDSPEPPEDLEWNDLGAKSVQVLSDMGSGWFENGEHATILLRIKYYYERWKYYIDPTAGIIMYEEWVIPEEAPGPVSYTSGVKTCHCGAVSGNAYVVGNQKGVYRSFKLAGTEGYYWSPAVIVGFTVSYPTKEVTLGVQIKAERHYTGAVKIYVEIAEDRSLWLWGYDAGTNWGTVYLAWAPLE